MRSHRTTASLAATGLAAAVATAPAAAAHAHEPGTTSLAEVLAADTSGFDTDSFDYDITAAVGAVLAAEPDSPVAVLADGTVPLTAFIPTDKAFRTLVEDLTGERLRSEEEIFTAVAGLGIDTVETVLLYHVVPGDALDSGTIAESDGLVLTTAQGGTVEVDVRYWGIRLTDADPDDKDAVVIAPDINEGNRQVAHGVKRVLRPVDL